MIGHDGRPVLVRVPRRGAPCGDHDNLLRRISIPFAISIDGRGEARFIFERAFTLGNEARIKTLRVIGNFAEGGGKNLMFSFDRVSELWVADMGFR